MTTQERALLLACATFCKEFVTQHRNALTAPDPMGDMMVAMMADNSEMQALQAEHATKVERAEASVVAWDTLISAAFPDRSSP